MPTYEYECRKCGRRFERFQAMPDAPLEECPECRGEVHRLIVAGAGVITKGPRAAMSCGNERPCCGRETRCDKGPCH